MNWRLTLDDNTRLIRVLHKGQRSKPIQPVSQVILREAR
jgi:hypothetical protein